MRARSITRGRLCVVVLVASVLGAIVLGACRPAPVFDPPVGPVGRLHHAGRWFVDSTGRVVQLHGVNFVQKFPPVTPGSVGFDADDARFVREQGWNVVRLGVVFGAVVPEPGRIDRDYVDGIVDTVRTLARERVFTLIDWHQDGFGPLVHGNGFPEWATLTDGLANPEVPFPTYYLANPALQRAFDNFWANRSGPDGVPLQVHYAAAVRAVAAALAGEPTVVGYDLMNEPWPGTDWSSCATGCPDLEARLLEPFTTRMTAAIRSVDRRAMVFSEPFVLFNFGQASTTVGDAGTPLNGLSYHVYALSPDADEAVMDQAIASSATTRAALFATEFGATNDPAIIRRLTDAFDRRLLPWVFWSYAENVVIDVSVPPTTANVRGAVVDVLARPYAITTNGTPTEYAYDPATGAATLGWSTVAPGGGHASSAPTTIVIPARAFPAGYTASVAGGRVVSQRCSATLQIRADTGAASVRVDLRRAACR